MSICAMKKTIGRKSLPSTARIEELARFWDSHDLTDFDNELKEVCDPVFVPAKGASPSIDPSPGDAQRRKTRGG
jgi:hypothetical protein